VKSMSDIIIGERLREAREARKMTQEDLARRVGITRASISAFEKSLKSPGIRTAAQIAGELEIPLAYMQNGRPHKEGRTSPLSYRRRARATLAIQNQMSRMEEWLADIHSVFGCYIDFPEVNLPKVEPTEHESLSDDDIEKAAVGLRAAWGMGIGPIANLMDFAEANGIVVGRAVLESGIDAVSVWRTGTPHVLLNRNVRSCARARMSLAHELGHIVLHGLVGDEVYDRKEKYDLLERQASSFAGCFLFPAQSFSAEFRSCRFEALLMLKRRWNVSMGAILMRAKGLGLADEDGVAAFYRQLCMKGYSRSREPLDDSVPTERVGMFSEANEMLIANGIPLRRIVDETLLSAADFCSITDIDPAAYAEKNVRILQFRKPGD